MGNLGALRQALKALATYEYKAHVPGDWQPWIAKLQAAARPGIDVKTLEEAALIVAKTASVCGECHLARGAGPQFPEDYTVDDVSGSANTLHDRMQRHVWAANRMWEGLTAPSDKAWRAGATGLASMPLKAPREKPALLPEFARELRQLRELGDRARGDYEVGERAQTFGRFLATCAKCHEHEFQSAP